MATNLPTTLLRSFVTIVDAGTMLDATKQVFVTQSALSLQIKRLETLVQQPLFLRDGRRLALTEAGTLLLGYARRMLALHDEALQAVSDERVGGPIRFGTVQDFAEMLLTGVLARFAELHPDSQIFARVAGTAELLAMLEKGQLDMVFGYAAAEHASALSIAATGWYGDTALAQKAVIPLAVLEPPCRFREAATAGLDRAGREWRIAVETPNLSTLRAAVRAGLGLTCRTAFFLPNDLPIHDELPGLPDVACVIEQAKDPAPHKARLAALAADVIRAL